MIIIDAPYQQQRLDNYLLRELKGVPKGLLYRLLRTGAIRINGKRVKVEYRLQDGDRLYVPKIRMAKPQTLDVISDALRDYLQQAVLFEDTEVLIVNKPSGLAVHRGTGVQSGLIEALRTLRPQEKQLALAHRIDRDTSGCVLIAKNRAVLKQCHELWRTKQVCKTYHVLVSGKWPKEVSQIDAPLYKHERVSGERHVQVNSKGQTACTSFYVLRRFKDATLLAAFPQTGRMHQIRVHCQHAGHAIIGDNRYNDKLSNRYYAKHYSIKRLFLHAQKIVLRLNKQWIRAEAPYDMRWQKAMDRLQHEKF